MNGLNALMRYAERRGDGLLPELRDFFAAEAEKAIASNVVDLLLRNNLPAQAGPNPVAALPDELPENVVVFRPSDADRPQRKPKSTRASRKRQVSNSQPQELA